MTCLISIVVLGFRNFDNTTRPCLESLLPWIDDPEIEMFVVDNGSPDDSAQKTHEWCARYPQVKYLISDHNRGYGGGMNWGAAHTHGKWLLLVNNDTLFPANTLDALKRVIREAPEDVAMLGPVTNAAGNGQRLWKSGATFEEWLKIGAELNQKPTHLLMPTYRCDFFTIAIRRDVWDQLGGLDLAFGLGYYEDFDFSLRVTKAGYRQMIAEDVFILHIGSATFRGNKAVRVLMKSNKKLLASKHKYVYFEHAREGNLSILKMYAELKLAGRLSHDMQLRVDLRHAALDGDVPKSIVKRWWWRKKIASIKHIFEFS